MSSCDAECSVDRDKCTDVSLHGLGVSVGNISGPELAVAVCESGPLKAIVNLTDGIVSCDSAVEPVPTVVTVGADTS